MLNCHDSDLIFIHCGSIIRGKVADICGDCVYELILMDSVASECIFFPAPTFNLFSFLHRKRFLGNIGRNEPAVIYQLLFLQHSKKNLIIVKVGFLGWFFQSKCLSLRVQRNLIPYLEMSKQAETFPFQAKFQFDFR